MCATVIQFCQKNLDLRLRGVEYCIQIAALFRSSQGSFFQLEGLVKRGLKECGALFISFNYCAVFLRQWNFDFEFHVAAFNAER